MTPAQSKLKRVGPIARTPMVNIVGFKDDARRILASNHPALKIISRLPDTISAIELDHRLDDIFALLEA